MVCSSQQLAPAELAESFENGGRLMIEQVVIENFRCFQYLKVSGLKRMNVIVGRNSSGKSSFLEALFLSSGSNAANISFQMRAIRRLGTLIQAPNDPRGYESLWEDLFHDFDINSTISIEIVGKQAENRRLWISFLENSMSEIQFGKETKTSLGASQVKFTWKRGKMQPIVSKPTVTSTGLQFGTVPIDFFPVIWFHPNVGDSADEVGKRYSTLSKKGELDPVINALKGEFDFLDDISLEFLSSAPMIFASIKGSKVKMPLGLISDGVNRLLAILLGIAYFKGGAILIDQLEDGFYFDRLPSIWKVLHQFAVDRNCQLFITTHSRECLESMIPTLAGNEDDFVLLRAERQGTNSTFTSIEGKFLEGALKQGFDPR